jgi:Protein of unknown function (DUF2911)
MRSTKLVVIGALVSVVATFAAVAHVRAGKGARVSPHESTYGRPSMRGRTIFGKLIPYGRVWCPGADEATTLESTHALRLGDVSVPAGSHTIWMRPTADAWALIISKEPQGFHTNYNASADLGSLELTKRALDTPVERLTFTITKNPAGPGGAVAMSWETTEVSVPFTVQ